MFSHVNAILLTAAGAVIVATELARRFTWWRANRPSSVVHYTSHGFAMNTAKMFAPNDVPWMTLHTQVIVDEDTGQLTIERTQIAEYEHEGTTERLTPGADLARVPLVVDPALMLPAELAAHAEREQTREMNALFERFDRMTTRGMAHVDTICKQTIERWITEDPEGEIVRWREYISTELPTVMQAYAEALLIS